MKKIIVFLLISVSIFGKMNLKVIYSNPQDKGITSERAEEFNSKNSNNSTKGTTSVKTESVEKDKTEKLVYITKSGKKYHKKSCRYSKHARPVSLEEAKILGLEACKVCGG